MPRIMLQYADKTSTYCWFVDGENPKMVIGKQNYTVEEIANTGAVVVVNNSELLSRMIQLGINARPTPRQNMMSVAVSADTKDRVMNASKKVGKKASRIIEQLIIEWLDKNGY